MHPLAKLFAFGITILGGYKIMQYITKKRVFISFAIEDKTLRDFLVGQSKNDDTPFEFIDMSIKEPWDSKWKTNCRERIKECDGVIVLVTKNLPKADGALWEIKCAKEEGIPMMPIYGGDEHKSASLPDALKGKHVYTWSWDNIKNFISRLEEKKRA